MLRTILLLLLFVLPMVALADSETDAAIDQRWNFRVFLDDKEIGTHDYALRRTEDGRELSSVAEFNVKFLFFTAYKYRHRNEERWHDGCLTEIKARTVTNGDAIEVSGRKAERVFAVETDTVSRELPACIMSFAYWDKRFMQEDKLLNPQTGEFLPVSIEAPVQEQITVRGRSVDAQRYRMTAKDVELQLWYSENDEWLALESVVKGGRTIRYELI